MAIKYNPKAPLRKPKMDTVFGRRGDRNFDLVWQLTENHREELGDGLYKNPEGCLRRPNRESLTLNLSKRAGELTKFRDADASNKLHRDFPHDIYLVNSPNSFSYRSTAWLGFLTPHYGTWFR